MSHTLILPDGTFAGKAIRCTPDHYASIYDVMKVAGVGTEPTHAWNKLKHMFPNDWKWYKFEGQGQRQTPVIQASAVDKFLHHLPGLAAQKTILTIHGFVSDDSIGASTVERPLERKRINRQCALYVRTLEDENLIKFGISTSLESRHRQLKNDGGSFIASVTLNTEKQARHVESVFCALFRGITIDTKNEYICTEKLSRMLKIERNTSYRVIAQTLFGMIAKMAHQLYPESNLKPCRVYNSTDYTKYIEAEGKHLIGYSELSDFFK